MVATITSRMEALKSAAGRLFGNNEKKARPPAPVLPDQQVRGGLARTSASAAPAAAPASDPAVAEAPASTTGSQKRVALGGGGGSGAATPPNGAAGAAPAQQAGAGASSNVLPLPPGAAGAAAAAARSADPTVHDLGFPRGLTERFELGQLLGAGGSGVVRVATDKRTGKAFACKSIPKVLRDPAISDAKKAGHAAALRREVDVLRRLRGGLNVASLEDVFEDDDAVHLVLELCAGGELWHAIGDRHYSERTVASYMRAVLRTLAQCHAAGILHRDVKPGNFMLLSGDERAPLKAVDFGLAVPFDKGGPPREDLGLEGTPWYMAPEVLGSKVGPEADIWAAGVMAFQLLSGRFPFDDRKCPASPSLAKIWKSILTDKLSMSGSAWDGISDEAKDFVATLLARDPADRPTAVEALAHPWLRGKSSERSTGRPLSLAVVQRVQRYASSSLFKRTVLQCIAQELLEAGSTHGGLFFKNSAAAAAGTSTAGANTTGTDGAPACALDARARPILAGPADSALQYLYSVLEFGDDPDACIERSALIDGLERLGYRLGDGEAERLLAQLGDAPRISRAALAASQIDWAAVQERHADAWTRAARTAFDAFDTDRDGVIKREEMVAALAGKAPPAEVDAAVGQAMAEACKRDASVRDGLSFDAFVRMLRADPGADTLELYEDRLGSSSGHGGDAAQAALAKAGAAAVPGLPSVAE